MRWLNRLDRKIGRYAIPRLMYGITAGMLIVYIIDFFLMTSPVIIPQIYLNMELVAQGEVWRLITFIFVPYMSSNILFTLISLYFYVLIGNGLEQRWGSFKFNVFYLVGIIGINIGALFTGYGVNSYLNLSMFLAFAAIYPDFQIMLFFIVPVKMKYLALLDVALLIYSFVIESWPARVSIIMALLNVVLFFGMDFIRTIKDQMRYRKTRANFRRSMRR